MAELNKYNHHDMRRYLDNQMTPQEMNAFEKALLEDSFLSDAMEGYEKSDAATTEEHLKYIKGALAAKSDKAQVVPLVSSRRNYWWRIAALLIVLAGMTTVMYYVLNESNTETQLAAVPAPARIADSIGAVEPPASSRDRISNQPAMDMEKAKKPPATKPLTYSNELATTEIYKPEPDTPMMTDRAVAMRSVTPGIASSTPPQSMRQFSKVGPPELKEFRGKVLDSSGRPPALANVISENKVATVTDIQGNFSIVAPDSSLTVNISSAGFASVKEKLEDDSTNRIVLKEASSALSEVVVVGYGSAKKQKAARKPTTAVSAQPATPTAEPEGGWESFQEYAYRQLNKPVDTTDRSSGDIMIEFNIDEKGNPKNIFVLPPVDKETAEKAVQLLRKGPRWKRTSKGDRRRVRIKI